MTTSTNAVDASALLSTYQRDLGLNDAQAYALVADSVNVPLARASAWFWGTRVRSQDVRKLLMKLNIEREVAVKTLDLTQLLAALWGRRAGAVLANARELSGLDRDQLATATGISDSTILRWERGTHSPRAGALAPVLETVGLTVYDMLESADWPATELPVGPRPAFATWVVRTREDLGMPQARLADALLMSQCTLSAWENGQAYPKRSTWARVAATFTNLGVPLDTEKLLMLQLPEPADADNAPTALSRMLIKGRLDRCLSRSAVGHLIGVPFTTIRSWELGQSAPALPMLEKVARALWLDTAVLTQHTQDAHTALLEDRTHALLHTKYAGRHDRGAWIGARIGAMGVRNLDIAAELGVTRNVMSFWISGRLAVPEDLTVKLAELLLSTPERVAAQPSEPNTTFIRDGQALVVARKRAGYSQRSLARALGVKQTQVSAYESGKNTPQGRIAGLLFELIGAPRAA